MSTDLLSVDEAAAILRMTVRTLKRLAKRGDVPCVLLPDGDYRFTNKDLTEWVLAHRQGPSNEKKAGVQPGLSVNNSPGTEGQYAEQSR